MGRSAQLPGREDLVLQLALGRVATFLRHVTRARTGRAVRRPLRPDARAAGEADGTRGGRPRHRDRRAGEAGRPLIRPLRRDAQRLAARPRLEERPQARRLFRRGRARDGHPAHRNGDRDHAGRRRELRPRDFRRAPASALRGRLKLREDGVPERGPGVLRPVAELAVGQDAAGGPRAGVDPDERAGGAEVAERLRRVARARPVRRLVVPQLEREAPVVRRHAPEAREHAVEARKLHRRRLRERLVRAAGRTGSPRGPCTATSPPARTPPTAAARAPHASMALRASTAGDTRRMERRLISSGSSWEERYGYSRAVVAGGTVYVAGTAPIMPGDADPPQEPYEQARRCLEIAQAALAEAGARIEDVGRTRGFVTDAEYAPGGMRGAREGLGAGRPAGTRDVAQRLEPRLVRPLAP